MKRTTPLLARASWLLVALVAAPAVSGALDGRSAPVATTAMVEGWLLWGAAWLATLVPRTSSLTVHRVVAPLALVVAVAALVAGTPIGWGIALLVAAILATTAACAGVTTDAFVDGSSYGSERRFGLRVPPAVATLAVPLTWAVAAVVASVPLLLAAQAWVLAAVAALIGAAFARPALRSLHQLSRRWVVFVPAGMVLHDPLVLGDAVLFPRRTIAGLAPAYADTDATDLTQGALGLALQADLVEPVGMSLRAGRGGAMEEVRTDRFVFTPLRPGALLDAAATARVKVG